MITSVLFDMGGTLEDIFVDEASDREAVRRLDGMLRSWGMDPGVDLDTLRERVSHIHLVRLCAVGLFLPPGCAGTPLRADRA